MMNPLPFHDLDVDASLRTILEGTATETGERFFAALVENLARALNTHGAWVTEYIEEQRRLKAMAFWMGGQWIHGWEMVVDGTPCERVIDERCLIHIPDNLLDIYGNVPDVRAVGAASYMGMPLLDLDGKILGHLAVLDLRPMHAIIELNRNLNVTRVNAAAEKVFGCSSSEIVGQLFTRFLSSDSRERLARLIIELDLRPEGERYAWIPGGLNAQSASGEAFPAEATVSRFDMGREPFYTLILRNVNARLQARQKIRSLTVEAEYLREEIKELQSDEIVGQSEPLARVLRDIQEVAGTDANVLILGETGTGKELIARAIHRKSHRCEKPLIKVNCAAMPATLIESELFGHEQGAFTGATKKREGRFALADGGTIFLDEIGELPVELQVKLLRVLQEGEFEPVGSSRTQKVDVRVIAATNRDLKQATKEGKFREDLYYRLNVFPIELPPLRERGDDISLLASTFAKKFAQRMGRLIEPLSEACMGRLRAYGWPGNVRELQNVIERAVITSRDGRLNLDRALPESGKVTATEAVSTEDTANRVRTAKEFEELERANVIAALEATSWRVAGNGGAAQLLGMKPTTLSSRMKALGIERKR